MISDSFVETFLCARGPQIYSMFTIKIVDDTESSRMSDLETQFRDAADSVKRLQSRPSDGELLELYALFKQATAGNNTEPKPGIFQMIERAKHDAWLSKKGTSQMDAKMAYISKVRSIAESLGTN